MSDGTTGAMAGRIHTCSEGRPVVHVGGLSEGRVSAAHVVVVATKYHRGLQTTPFGLLNARRIYILIQIPL